LIVCSNGVGRSGRVPASRSFLVKG
jgi:hypothetical protein